MERQREGHSSHGGLTEGTRVSQPQRQPPNVPTALWSEKLFSASLQRSQKTRLKLLAGQGCKGNSLKSKATLSLRLMFAKSQETRRKGPKGTSKLVQDKNQFKTAIIPSSVCNLRTRPSPRGQSRRVCLTPARTFAEGWVCS